jgi:hypothetical protein
MLAFECWLESFIRTEYEKYKEEEQQNDVREDEDVERLTRESVAVLIREILEEDEVLSEEDVIETSSRYGDTGRIVSKEYLDKALQFYATRVDLTTANIKVEIELDDEVGMKSDYQAYSEGDYS